MLKSYSLSIIVVFLVQISFVVASISLPFNSTDLQEGQTQEVGIIFPPGMPQKEMIERIYSAGAVPLKSGQWNFVQMAIMHEKTELKSLYNFGAIFVFNPIIKGACILESKNQFITI